MLNPLSSQALHSAISEQPSLSLNFYSFGITLRKCEGDLQTEYPVDPAQVMQVLSTKITFTTGLLSQNTLYVHQEINRVQPRHFTMTAIGMQLKEDGLRLYWDRTTSARRSGCATTGSDAGSSPVHLWVVTLEPTETELQ